MSNFFRKCLKKHFLKITLLSAHEIYFKRNNEYTIDKLKAKIVANYEESDTIMMLKLVETIITSPNISLLEYVKIHKQSLPYLLALFLILEKERAIHIIRPGI